MATEILAVGTTAANSADVVLDAGDQMTVCLKDTAGPNISYGARVNVLLKDDAGQYFLIDNLVSSKPAIVIVASGTYRFQRVAGVSCGVFRA